MMSNELVKASTVSVPAVSGKAILPERPEAVDLECIKIIG
jgi:hypothetical protein